MGEKKQVEIESNESSEGLETSSQASQGGPETLRVFKSHLQERLPILSAAIQKKIHASHFSNKKTKTFYGILIDFLRDPSSGLL